MVFLYIAVLFLVLSALFWQYIRVAFSRAVTQRKIEKICLENKISYKRINNFAAFAKNKNERFDFILKVENTVIPVKFYSALSPRSAAYINTSGKILIREAYRKPLSRTAKKETADIKRYTRLPSMKLKKGIISDKYTVFPVFLNEPSFLFVKIIDSEGKARYIDDQGTLVAGCNWFDRETFVSLLMVYAARQRKDSEHKDKKRQKD